jgi:hypothetical protein
MAWVKANKKMARMKTRSIKRDAMLLRPKRQILAKRADTEIIKTEIARATSQRGVMALKSGCRIRQIKDYRNIIENAVKAIIKDGRTFKLVSSKLLLNPGPEEISHDAQDRYNYQKN